MKKIRLSVITLLTVMIVSLSSCLGDGDSTYPVYGTGHMGSLSQVVLDNGVRLNVTNISSSADLSGYDRVYIAGTIVEEGYKGEAVSPGQSLSVEASQIGQFFKSEWKSSENDLEEEYLSDFDSFKWFTYGGVGNGYMNFELVGTILFYSNDGKSEVIEPTTYVNAQVNPGGKRVDLTIGFDNRRNDHKKDDNSSELESGYYAQSNTLFPVTIDMQEIYKQLSEAGLSDEDEVTFGFKKMYNLDNSGNKGESKTIDITPGQHAFKLGFLKNQY